MENPFETESNKPTTGLKTLTILSIVGSIIYLISNLSEYFLAEKVLEAKQQMIDSGKLSGLPGFLKSQYSPEAMRLTENMVNNKLPIMIVGVLGSLLCLFGALEMRKLKKQGFHLWLVGELLPVASTIVFVGASKYEGIGMTELVFPFLFVVLYFVYRKELRY